MPLILTVIQWRLYMAWSNWAACAGVRRSLMVVEAPRGLQSHPADSAPNHVEHIASSLASLPACTVRHRLATTAITAPAQQLPEDTASAAEPKVARSATDLDEAMVSGHVEAIAAVSLLACTLTGGSAFGCALRACIVVPGGPCCCIAWMLQGHQSIGKIHVAAQQLN